MEDASMKNKYFLKPLIVISTLLILVSPMMSGLQGSRINTVRAQGEVVNPTTEPIPQAPDAINAAPNAPVLVSPANGATDVPISPSTSLQVTVTDPEADPMTVNFYGAQRPDFTLVVLPDSKYYTLPANLGLHIFEAQTQWIVNQWSGKNIAFVSHLGDLVDCYNCSSEWDVADAGMNTLDSAGIPYGITFGNSDEDNEGFPPGTTYLNSYFPVSRYFSKSYYGGAYNGDNANSYQLFSASGMDFIVINLQYNLSYYPDKSAAILSWADTLLKNNANRRAIVLTHSLLDGSNNFTVDGSQVYSALKNNPNLFLMMGGHLVTEGMRTDTYNGHTVYSLRSDYQDRANGGNGWLRVLTFSPDENKINVTTYSPTLDQYETDSDSQFSLNYDMGGTGFSLIGSQPGVASGSTVTQAWAGLAAGTQYQWYVTASDATLTTTGPTWRFTTLPAAAAPAITSQPTNLTVTAGKEAFFTAAASGYPIPTVQWQVSTGGPWTNILGATSTTYHFTAAAGDTGKQYHAVFTNASGSVTSSAATLTVNTIPAITTQPLPQTVTAGSTATFIAAASGVPVPTVQWQWCTALCVLPDVWTNVSSGGTSATYITPVTVAADNGKQFRAVFTNFAGSATSNAASLTVNFAPVITTQPTPVTVIAGGTATFTTAANGNPTPTVKWQVSTGGPWSDIPGATSLTLSFTAQFADNNNQYRAIFTNSVGSTTSSAATLTVNTAPLVTTQPSNLTVNPGGTASFTALASGSPVPTVQWQVCTNLTCTNPGDWTNIGGATSTTYSFTAQSVDNGKHYRAVFTNIAGTDTSNPATLTVNSLIVITIQPNNQTVNTGDTATFSAAATGSPAPTVQWQVSINGGSTWTNISGATSTTFSFAAQVADDGKQYRAVFTNPTGTATTNAALLTVYYAPIVTTQPANQTKNAGQTATFIAAASGNPSPTAQWQVSLNGTDWSDISGETSTTYSFTAQPADNGKQYRARFSNFRGNVNSNAAILTVYTAPSVTAEPSSQTVNAGQPVSFTAAASGNPSPTVQWQLSINNGSTWTNISGATSTTYGFTAQIADNGKQYRAVFTNLVGAATSDAAVLTVHYAPAVTTQPANQTVTVEHTASFMAAASGNPNPTVQWQVSSDNGSTWSDIPGAISTSYSFIAHKADDGNKYRAVFTNAVGTANSNSALLTLHYYATYLSIVKK
jgi:hypothetical protein